MFHHLSGGGQQVRERGSKPRDPFTNQTLNKLKLTGATPFEDRCHCCLQPDSTFPVPFSFISVANHATRGIKVLIKP
jgi:hypothetical protein